jgi:predicted pyridoxine 5'-phosphate oxidase superfamily flavin-nucleotide-binding protein
MAHKYLELAYTPAVRAAQQRYYGRSTPAPAAAPIDPLGAPEREFIAARDSFYLATVSETGWPYVQHRGGPPGFLHVLDANTLGFADCEGNHQMISTGNLAANDRVALFLMDYPRRRRLKLLGRARVEAAEDHPAMADRLSDAATRESVERLFLIDVVSFDWNCPKYITRRFSPDEVEAVVRPLQQRIAALEEELASATAQDRGSAERRR